MHITKSNLFIEVILICSIIILLNSSCSTEDTHSITGCGSTTIDINMDYDIKSSHFSTSPDSTKKPSFRDFNISISNIDGSFNHLWKTPLDLPKKETLQTGSYLITAFYGDINDEGFDKPYYCGSASIEIAEASANNVSIPCSLANAMISISYSNAFRNAFSDYCSILHTPGSSYLTHLKDETRPLYLKPGETTIAVSFESNNGANATLQPITINTQPRHHYLITIDVDYNSLGEYVLIVKYDTLLAIENTTITLTDEILNSPTPEITTIGFSDKDIINIIEGENLPERIETIVNSKIGISEITITTNSPSLIDAGFPHEIKLGEITPEQLSIITSMGLTITGFWDNKNCASIDFTNLLSRLKATDNNLNSFTIIAKDYFFKTTNPISLIVSTTPININIVNTPQSIIGDNLATLAITSSHQINPNLLTISATDDNGILHKSTIKSICDKNDSTLITFSIPHGMNDSNAKIYYNNSFKASTTISRISPNFKIDVDAFASSAAIKVITDNNEMTNFITQNLHIFANDYDAKVVGRDLKKGIIYVSGLKPSTSYSFKATLMKNNPNATYSNIVKITTETNIPIPDGSFESVKESINKTIPSGGWYSQTHLPIYNQQNQTNVSIYTPKEDWATVNKKTFCEIAKNQNSWYMQPSTFMIKDAINGTKAMKLVSVAWDTNGEKIKDYAQDLYSEHINYNKNIPNISNRAAGKLFLGKYNYDPTTNTEQYIEGIPFASRPSALNGYFKYTPCASNPTDKGIVIISLLNKSNNNEFEIASNSYLFNYTSDYTAFSIPLTYCDFGVKATHLKIMFASSYNIGSIPYENANIATLPHPQTASSIGSILILDNLNFSY